MTASKFHITDLANWTKFKEIKMGLKEIFEEKLEQYLIWKNKEPKDCVELMTEENLWGWITKNFVPVERVVSTKIANIVKDIMQEGFEIAMGGSMDLSEEANRKEQTARYDRAVKNYTEIIASIRRAK